MKIELPGVLIFAVIVLILMIGVIIGDVVDPPIKTIDCDQLELFAECVAPKATLYYSTTCSWCQTQKWELGSQFGMYDTYQCNENAFSEEHCEGLNITRYPTWVVGEDRYEGYLKLTQIAAVSGCDL